MNKTYVLKRKARKYQLKDGENKRKIVKRKKKDFRLSDPCSGTHSAITTSFFRHNTQCPDIYIEEKKLHQKERCTAKSNNRINVDQTIVA